MIEFFQMATWVCLALGAIFAVLAVLFFLKYQIISVINDLNGKTAFREISALKARGGRQTLNKTVLKKVRDDFDENLAKETTDKLPIRQKAILPIGKPKAVQRPSPTAQTGAETTTILGGVEATTVLGGIEPTSVLRTDVDVGVEPTSVLRTEVDVGVEPTSVLRADVDVGNEATTVLSEANANLTTVLFEPTAEAANLVEQRAATSVLTEKSKVKVIKNIIVSDTTEIVRINLGAKSPCSES